MLKKSVLFLALAALLLAGCGAAAGGYSSEGVATGLSVNGHGEVTLPPDVAYISIGVHSSGTNVSQAVSDNAAQVAEVMAALTDMGIAREDMQTSNFSVYTSDNYDPITGQINGTNYTVDNTVNVTARELDRLGELLDRAVSAGANSIWGVTFDLENKDEALAQARDLAVQDALDGAQALASAAGVNIGKIISVSYTNTGYYPGPYYGLGGGGAGEGAATSIVPGLITVSADVYVTYAIQ